MFTLITGRQGSGKSRAIYAKIAEDIKKNREIYLIVPEQYSFQAEKELIDYLQSDGVIGVHVVSFSRLAYQLLSKIGTMAMQPLSKKAALVILKKILMDVAPSLKVFARSWRHDGFCEMMYQCILEMKKNRMKPSQLHDLAKGEGLQQKIAEIARIYQAYEEYIHQGYCDVEDMMEQAAAEVQKQQSFLSTCVYVDGFHTLDKQRVHLLEKIMAQASAVTVAITYEEENGREVFALTKKLREDLLACAQKHNVQTQTIHLQGKKNSTQAMGHLEKKLFQYQMAQSKKFDIEEVPQIIKTSTLRREMILAAEKVLEFVQMKELRYRDIALFTNDLDAYRPLAKEVFAAYNIPLFIDEKYDIEQNALVRMLFALLQMFERDAFAYTDVFAYLKSGYTALSDEQINRLENYVLRYGIKGRAYFEEFWKTSREDEQALAEINRDREVFAQEVLVWQEQLKQAKTYDDFAEVFFKILAEPCVAEKTAQNKKFCEEQALYVHSSIEEQIIGIVQESLTFIAFFLKGQPAQIEEFHQVLKQSVLSQQAGILPVASDCVILGDFARSRTSDIAVAIVVGANEGVMPKGLTSEGIFTQREKRELTKAGLDLLGEAENHSIKERFYIYNTLSKPLHRLIISAPLINEAGEGLEMSFVAESVAKMFDIDIQDDDIDAMAVSNQQGTYHRMVQKISNCIQNKTQPEEKTRSLFAWYKAEEQYTEKIQRLSRAVATENKIENVTPEQMRQVFSDPFEISASNMQIYAGCPFEYFVRYILKPKKREIWEISSLDIGIFMHHIGQIFTEHILTNEVDVRAMRSDEVNRLVEEIIAQEERDFKNDVFGSDALNAAMLKGLKRAAQKSLEKMIVHLSEGKFDIAGSEIGFGNNQPLPGVYLGNVEGYDVSVEGKIDRLDVYERQGKIYCKVIDYKTGNKDINYSHIYHGLDLQLNFYMQACLAADDNHLPAGMFYYKLHHPIVAFDQDIASPAHFETLQQALDDEMRLVGVAVDDVEIVAAMDQDFKNLAKVAYSKKEERLQNTDNIMSKEEIDKMLRYSAECSKGFAKDILSGIVAPRPYKHSCERCLYRGICKFNDVCENVRYRRVEKLNKKTFLEKIEEEMKTDESI